MRKFDSRQEVLLFSYIDQASVASQNMEKTEKMNHHAAERVDFCMVFIEEPGSKRSLYRDL